MSVTLFSPSISRITRVPLARPFSFFCRKGRVSNVCAPSLVRMVTWFYSPLTNVPLISRSTPIGGEPRQP